MTKSIHVCRHPVLQHKLSLLRSTDTSAKDFRDLMAEIGLLLGYEATRDLVLREEADDVLSSPLSEYTGVRLADTIGLVPVLRAGLGLVNSMLSYLPEARVLHLGIYRDKTSLQPVEYYNKLPEAPNVDLCIVLDPMVATAGTAIATVNILKDWGVKRIKFICVCASKDGLKTLSERHPDVEIFAGVVDEGLSSDGYIIPGMGDAGDRLFATPHPHDSF